MPTKPITTKSITATFGETLLHALEQFSDPVTLGRTSPLAKPYLLDNIQNKGLGKKSPIPVELAKLQGRKTEGKVVGQTPINQATDSNHACRM